MEKTLELIITHIPIIFGKLVELIYTFTLYPVYCILWGVVEVIRYLFGF